MANEIDGHDVTVFNISRDDDKKSHNGILCFISFIFILSSRKILGTFIN